MKFKLLLIFMMFLIIPSVLSQEVNLTEDDALLAIESAENNLLEMSEFGFTTTYINDTLSDAKKTLDKVDGDLFTFKDVISYTDEIGYRKETAYELNDLLRALELRINDYNIQNINISLSKSSFEKAKQAFKEERYEDTSDLILQSGNELESASAQKTLLNVMKSSSKSFFQKYWIHLIISLIFILIISYIIFLNVRKSLAKDKLKIMSMEKGVLIDLIKESQDLRFNKGKISPRSYRIRTEYFKDRLTEINHQLPVLEAIVKGKKFKKKS